MIAGYTPFPITTLPVPVMFEPALAPITILHDPAAPMPFDVPIKMFDDPPPPALPPMLMVFETFERPVELEVPMRIEL